MMKSITETIMEFFKELLETDREEFDRACDINNIYGIYRVMFETDLKKYEVK